MTTSLRREKVRRALLAHYGRGGDAIALLAMRSFSPLPGAEVPINVGRSRSLRLAEWVQAERPIDIGVRLQLDEGDDDPPLERLPPTGIVVEPLKAVRVAPDRLSIVLRGTGRFRVVGDVLADPFHRARVERWVDPDRPFDADAKRLKEAGMAILAAPNTDARRARAALEAEERPGVIADLVAGQLRGVEPEDLRAIVDAFDPATRVELVLDLLERRAITPPPSIARVHQ